MKYSMLAGIFMVSIVGGCANSGVVEIGPQTYMIERQASGVIGLGSLKGDTIREAGKFCVSTGRSLKVTSTYHTKPPYINFNWPRVEIIFMCLSDGDRDLTRPKLEPIDTTPQHIIIENR